MNRFKIFSIAFLTASAIVQAQDIDQAKKLWMLSNMKKQNQCLKVLFKLNQKMGKLLFY